MIKKISFFILVVCVFFITINVFAGSPVDDDSEYFVQRAGNGLILNGKPYYFNATNNDHLYHWSKFMIEDVLESAKGLGLTAIRIWASSEGQNSWKDGYCFQPDPGEYHEDTFLQMDYIIAKAKEKGIRLILPLVNNWDDGYGGMPQYVKWCLGDVNDWSDKTTLSFDLYNVGDARVADVAIRTGPQWTWHESFLTILIPGWNYISYDLTDNKWKTEASQWEYNSHIENLDQVQAFSIGVFEYTYSGAVYIDNIRFDLKLFDGLEEIDNWYATDYSHATAVQLSSNYVSEGSRSLKMTYSYSAGEYNKAFAENQPQVEKNEFYTNADCKQLYKDYINYVLNRENTETGIAYKDDPTILMWELANEPRCESDPSGETLRSWIDEMAGHIKGIDSKHLVATGEEGWYNIAGNPNWKYDGSLGADYIRDHQSSYIDICSFHLYPEGYGMSDQENLDWIKKHLNDADNRIGKPVFLGEFGITANRKAAILYDFDADNEGWSIDWNYSQGPIQVESPSRNDNGAIRYTANINAVNTSCGGRIIYPEPGMDYSTYDYFTGWVYVPSSASAPADLTLEMYAHTGPNWNWTFGTNIPLVPGIWTQVKLEKWQIESLGGDITKVRSLGIQIKRGNTNYEGYVYYDVIGANLKDIYDASYQMSRRHQLYTDWYDFLDIENADGAAFWQLLAHQDDGSLFPDYWNWGVYYPEDTETSAIIQYFSALMKNKSGNAPPPEAFLEINPDSVEPGEPFTLTITCESPLTLDSAWWFVRNNSYQPGNIPGTVDGVVCNLAQDQVFDGVKGMLKYTRTMTVSIDNPGEYEINANARDILYSLLGQSHQISQGAGILVTAVNVGPQFAPMSSSYSIDTKETLSFIVTATDADGDQLSLKNLNPIRGAKFVVGKTVMLPDKTSMIKGRFNWTPRRSQAGSYIVQFRVRDSKGKETDSIPIQITVNKINRPPKIIRLRNIFNFWIVWLAKDKEDGYNLNYYYRVDQSGWSGPVTKFYFKIRKLKKDFNLKHGIHLFELKATDSNGAESVVNSTKFYIKTRGRFWVFKNYKN